MNISHVGRGKVVLIAGGGRAYTDIAARFVGSEKSLDEIIGSEYDSNIVKNIINSNHTAATEFDYFIFGIEGYSRVTEIQLVRKRLASYMIKSGRKDKGGKRSYDVVIPRSIDNIVTSEIKLDSRRIFVKDEYDTNGVPISLSDIIGDKECFVYMNTPEILGILENLYNNNLDEVPEEDLRYLKPQATEFKAIIGMNAHALLDWFKIRCCRNAQTEIRDLATKMLLLCREASPDLFSEAGPSCRVLGYCPENARQHKSCKGAYLTKDEAMHLLRQS